MCGKSTVIPIGGVCRVPKNYLLERQMNDVIEKLQAQQSPNLGCSQCYDQNMVIFPDPLLANCSNSKFDFHFHFFKANSFCVNCAINLCAVCRDAHLQQRWTSKHSVIALQLNNAKNKIPDHQVLKCFIHPTQDLQLYCTNCDQVACHNCTILLHKGHKFETIDSAKQHVIQTLCESVEKSKQFQQNIRNSICELAESIAMIIADADIVQVRGFFSI